MRSCVKYQDVDCLAFDFVDRSITANPQPVALAALQPFDVQFIGVAGSDTTESCPELDGRILTLTRTKLDLA